MNIRSNKISPIRLSMLCCVVLATLFTRNAQAQDLGNSLSLLEPSGTQYFQNQYLANPAMAGIDSGLHLNAAYRRQYNGIEGSPVTGHFSADGTPGRRVGLGFKVFNDEAGLITRTHLAATYAYHLPLGRNGQKLHFGLSLAFNVQRLDYTKVDGDAADPSLSAFNRRDNYFEAEYGMAYTNGHLFVQAALPNVRSLFTGKDYGVNGGGLFFTAASYRFKPEEGVISCIEPKICYRGIEGYDNILDAGFNLSILDNVANVMGMYHTSRSFTVGVGVNIKKTVVLQALYTTQTGGIKTYVDGAYEIGATVNLFR